MREFTEGLVQTPPTRGRPRADRFIRAGVLEHEYEIGELAKLGSEAGTKLISLDVADPYIETPDYIKKEMQRALRSKSDSTHYTRIRGLPEFTWAVSKFYHSKFNVQARSDARNSVHGE